MQHLLKTVSDYISTETSKLREQTATRTGAIRHFLSVSYIVSSETKTKGKT